MVEIDTKPNENCNLDGKRTKWFCNEVISLADGCDSVITTLEFDQDGDFLAYGNSQGIINIYEVHKSSQSSVLKDKFSSLSVFGGLVSHEPEFDCLNSCRIEPRINFLRWLPKHSQSRFILSANDYTIKMWKISQMPATEIINFNFSYELGSRNEIILRSPEDLKVPRYSYERSESQVKYQCRSKFNRGHKYPLTGLSLLQDGENFISSDSFQINLWNLNDSNNVFSIRQNEINLESPYISALDASNRTPSVFTFGDSFGSVNICDTRCQALCDKSTITIPGTVSLDRFSIIKCLSYISDIKFSKICDRFIYVRNFLELQIFDLTMPTKPVKVYEIHPHIKCHLSSLFDYDIGGFDRFKISLTNDNKYVATGSYDESFKVINTLDDETPIHDLSMRNFSLPEAIEPFSNSKIETLEEPKELQTIKRLKKIYGTVNGDSLNFDKKWLNCTFSPKDYTLAVANRSYIHLLEGIN